MSKIIIDGRMLGWTGIGRYTLSLLEQLEELDTDNTYVVLIQRKDWDRWSPQKANFSRLEVTIEPYTFAEQYRLPGVLNQQRADLVHFLNFNSPILYHKRRVVTVHDLTLLDFKNYRGNGSHKLAYEIKYRAMRAVIRSAIGGATAVITDTKYNKDQLAQRGYTTASKITPIPLGLPELPLVSAATKAPQQNSYLLYVGNLYPYKNLRAIIEALPRLIEKRPNLKLVIVGKEDVFAKELKQRARELNVTGAVVFSGFVSDAELAAYYRDATVYVFPSLSEGFGLPGLEAMGYGIPVAAAKASCLPEVYGNAAAYFNPHDVADIARVVGGLLDDDKQRADLKRRGLAHIKTFSWRRMAEQTLEVYKAALESK